MALIGAGVIGAVCLGAGVWGLLNPPPPEAPYWAVGAPFAASSQAPYSGASV